MNFCGTPGNEADYRGKAITRISSVGDLKHLRHLSKSEWSNCEYFWKWLANAPVPEILLNSNDLTVISFKRTAVHEAAHAIADYLAGMQLQYVTIAPNFQNGCTGRTFVQAEAFHLTNDPTYKGWRFLLSALVGPMSEEKILNQISGACGDDIATAVNLFSQLFPKWELSKWVIANLIFADRLVNSSIFLQSVQHLSKLLLKDGVVCGREVVGIIDQKMKRLGNEPEVVKYMRCWNFLILEKSTDEMGQSACEFRKWANDLFANDIRSLSVGRSLKSSQVIEWILNYLPK